MALTRNAKIPGALRMWHTTLAAARRQTCWLLVMSLSLGILDRQRLGPIVHAARRGKKRAALQQPPPAPRASPPPGDAATLRGPAPGATTAGKLPPIVSEALLSLGEQCFRETKMGESDSLFFPLATSGAVVVDAGANTGADFAIPTARGGGFALAFEPVPATVACTAQLCKRTSLPSRYRRACVVKEGPVDASCSICGDVGSLA